MENNVNGVPVGWRIAAKEQFRIIGPRHQRELLVFMGIGTLLASVRNDQRIDAGLRRWRIDSRVSAPHGGLPVSAGLCGDLASFSVGGQGFFVARLPSGDADRPAGSRPGTHLDGRCLDVHGDRPDGASGIRLHSSLGHIGNDLRPRTVVLDRLFHRTGDRLPWEFDRRPCQQAPVSMDRGYPVRRARPRSGGKTARIARPDSLRARDRSDRSRCSR